MHQWSIFKIFLLYVTGFVNPAASGFLNNVICFVKNGKSVTVCNSTLSLCDTGVVTQISTDIKYSDSQARTHCTSPCTIPSNATANRSDILDHCYGTKACTVNSTRIRENNGGALVFNVTCGASTNTSSLSTTSSRSPSTVPTTTDSGLSASSQDEALNSSTTNSTDSQASTTIHALNSATTTTALNSVTKTTGTRTEKTPTNFKLSGSSTRSTGSNITAIVSSTSSTVGHFLTGSGVPYKAVIAVSVVVFVIIVVVVIAILIYRRGHCKILLGKCAKRNNEHSPDMTDAYAMSSTANANPTYNLSSDVGGNSSDLDYSVINKFGKHTDVEYNHANQKKQLVQGPTYDHIGHFNSSPGNTEPTYNHVGDETSQTDSSILQADPYSHIGAVGKPAPEDSYAHLNGVMQYNPGAYEMDQYDSTVFQSNPGQTGYSGHRESEKKSGKENKFIVVGPSKVDMSSDAPVSNSYFVREKHEKEA